jgi:hypothetical protein
MDIYSFGLQTTLSTVSYQEIVLYIATLVFVLTMIVFWVITPSKSKIFPPVMSNCPTGWTLNQNGTCNIPTDGTNMGNLKGKGIPIYKRISNDGSVTYTTEPISGDVVLKDLYGNPILAYTSGTPKSNFPAGYDASNIQLGVVDFNSFDWGTHGSTLCANYEWALKNNIVWEGVSTFNHCK